MPSFKVRALICSHYDEEGFVPMEKHISDICDFYHNRIYYHTMLHKLWDEEEATLPEAQWSVTGRIPDHY